ncbi:phage tail protein, partial [Acinetobacter baumannii]|nr:phage tail protein [Acinetobacter baumannii]
MREAMALSEDKYLITRRKLLLLSLPFGYAIVNESKANPNSPIKVL